jgi:RNA polymerase sigma-70 factor (ECF subfamily)
MDFLKRRRSWRCSQEDETMFDPDQLQSGIDAAVRAVRGGDREAFRGVIEACETRLRVCVAPLLPDPGTVEDVVQQAFVTAYRKLDAYQLGTGFISWIVTIARYEALNERRRWLSEHSFKRRYQEEARIETAVFSGGGDLALDSDPALVERLHGCIDGLRERAAVVVRDHYFRQLPNEAIAASHGRNPAWVRLVLHRARLAIADCLKLRSGALHDQT